MKPGTDIFEYNPTAGDLDIVATFGRAARHIEVITAGGGALVMQCASSFSAPGSDTIVSRTLTVYDKWQRSLQVMKLIAAGSTATKVQLTF
jgi:hypothetical protein